MRLSIPFLLFGNVLKENDMFKNVCALEEIRI